MLPTALPAPPARGSSLGPAPETFDQGVLDSVQNTPGGEFVLPAFLPANNVGLVSNQLTFASFTASRSERVGTLRYWVAVAAGATPTFSQAGVYEMDAHGVYRLKAVTTSDTSMYTSATVFTRTLTPAFDKVAGGKYLIGFGLITGAALPSLVGHTMHSLAAYQNSLGSFSREPVAGFVTLGASALPQAVGTTGFAFISGTQVPQARLEA